MTTATKTEPKDTEPPVPVKLTDPFPPEAISILPKPTKRENPKGKCDECGGWHGLPAVHLDYVGHAHCTQRLLDVDPSWNWEPLAFDDDGMPRFKHNENGDPVGLWIRLTVLGVTRLGFGNCAAGKDDAEKELIGDALRNAAMRFGVALQLWMKEKPAETEGSSRSAGAPVIKPEDAFGPCDQPNCDGVLIRKTLKTKKGDQVVVKCSKEKYGDRGTCDRACDWNPNWGFYNSRVQRGEPLAPGEIAYVVGTDCPYCAEQGWKAKSGAPSKFAAHNAAPSGLLCIGLTEFGAPARHFVDGGRDLPSLDSSTPAAGQGATAPVAGSPEPVTDFDPDDIPF